MEGIKATPSHKNLPADCPRSSRLLVLVSDRDERVGMSKVRGSPLLQANWPSTARGASSGNSVPGQVAADVHRAGRITRLKVPSSGWGGVAIDAEVVCVKTVGQAEVQGGFSSVGQHHLVRPHPSAQAQSMQVSLKSILPQSPSHLSAAEACESQEESAAGPVFMSFLAGCGWHTGGRAIGSVAEQRDNTSGVARVGKVGDAQFQSGDECVVGAR